MIKKIVLFLFSWVCSFFLYAQDHFITEVGLKALIHNEENSFWSYSNTNGLVHPNTWLLGTLNSEYATYLSEYSSLALGGSAFYSLNEDHPNGVAINQYYGTYQLHNFALTLGAKQRPEKLMGLSSVGGDILWSNNARPVPGIELATIAPLKISRIVSVEGAFGHYMLNDDRHVDRARLHYKQLTFNFNTSPRSVFSLGLHHYAQWGGVSSTTGPEPNSFRDYMRIVMGVSGTTTATAGDQINALGNHLGSYRIDYKYRFRNKQELHLYHQTLFEDTSGREFQNFPDGVWGAFLSTPENEFLNGILYEYQHTLSQSGYARMRGSDNYFNNSMYRSGWTYFGETIGTPFITPNRDGVGIINNTYRAHHIGFTGAISKLHYTFKGSYVENMGLHRSRWEPTHKNLYTYLNFMYHPSERQLFGISLGADLNTPNNDQWTLSLEYRYRFGRLERHCTNYNCPWE